MHAPQWSEIPKYPVIAGVGLLAIVVTVTWWAGVDISFLFDNAEIRRGQLWRLLSSVFPHLGLLHLGFNLYWLWVLGTAFERVFGHSKTVLLLTLLAVGSNSLDFAFDRGGAGLSGVGYGLFGLWWVLSKRDERFSGVLDKRTVELFLGWFVICVIGTLTHTFIVANIAHAAGALLGALVGFVMVLPRQRPALCGSVVAVILFGIWGSTWGRPMVNLSGQVGFEEGKWGYDALRADRNPDAVRWLRDAVKFQPKNSADWFNLGVAYDRLGNMPAAIAAYERAHELDPKNVDYSRAAETKN
jgi:membrane associated rhomboid family serine protease